MEMGHIKTRQEANILDAIPPFSCINYDQTSKNDKAAFTLRNRPTGLPVESQGKCSSLQLATSAAKEASVENGAVTRHPFLRSNNPTVFVPCHLASIFCALNAHEPLASFHEFCAQTLSLEAK